MWQTGFTRTRGAGAGRVRRGGLFAPAFSAPLSAPLAGAPPLALLFRFGARGAALPPPSVLGLDAWRMEGRLFAGVFCWAEGAVGGRGWADAAAMGHSLTRG